MASGCAALKRLTFPQAEVFHSLPAGLCRYRPSIPGVRVPRYASIRSAQVPREVRWSRCSPLRRTRDEKCRCLILSHPCTCPFSFFHLVTRARLRGTCPTRLLPHATSVSPAFLASLDGVVSSLVSERCLNAVSGVSPVHLLLGAAVAAIVCVHVTRTACVIWCPVATG